MSRPLAYAAAFFARARSSVALPRWIRTSERSAPSRSSIGMRVPGSTSPLAGGALSPIDHEAWSAAGTGASEGRARSVTARLPAARCKPRKALAGCEGAASLLGPSFRRRDSSTRWVFAAFAGADSDMPGPRVPVQLRRRQYLAQLLVLTLRRVSDVGH